MPSAPPSQEASLEFGDFRRAFKQLGGDQREVLVLVGVGGLSYEEAAKVCNCAAGTVKSRVSRARHRLTQMLQGGQLAEARPAPRAQIGNIRSSFDLQATPVQ